MLALKSYMICDVVRLLILGTVFSKFITAVQITTASKNEVKCERQRKKNKNDGHNCFLIGFVAVFFSVSSNRGFGATVHITH